MLADPGGDLRAELLDATFEKPADWKRRRSKKPSLAKLKKLTLRELRVSSCPNLSDDGLAKVLKGQRKLESLDLSFNYQLTEKALQNVAKLKRTLKEFRMNGLRVPPASRVRIPA